MAKRGRPSIPVGRKRTNRVHFVVTDLEKRQLDMLQNLTKDKLSVIIRAAILEFYRAVLTGTGVGELSKPFFEAFGKWQIYEVRRRAAGHSPTPGLPPNIETMIEAAVTFVRDAVKNTDESSAKENRRPTAGARMPVGTAAHVT